jgi:hypothetical protein
MSDRRYCTKCGGNVMVEHPTLGLVDVPAGILPTLMVPHRNRRLRRDPAGVAASEDRFATSVFA